MENKFNPEIIAFCCHYCAYAAADLAGSMRLDYPASIKIVEMPCSGKVDPIYILQALEDGADGVLVAGWLPGDCHYLEGNLQARRRIEFIQKKIEEIGLDSKRVKMINVSAAMGSQFALDATAMTEEIRELGPNKLKENNKD
jgi:F420-non-reducing hydrogenase iron-sulfur subunit